MHIASSKIDQYQQGDTILVACTGSITCTVAMMEKYFSMGRLSHASSLALFCGITHANNSERLRSSGRLSYTRMWEMFLAKWNELGFDSTKFRHHSLRAGGATAAAKAGVPERLFRHHSRWKFESAKDGYVEDSC